MAYSILQPGDAHWRRSNQMQVQNTDLARQLGAKTLGARLWRLAPGEASTLHRHSVQHELYYVLEGTGRIRIDGEPLSLETGTALLCEPDAVRQVFNDGAEDSLWLVVGAPPEAANTLEMSASQIADLYPEGPKALPPELGGGTRD